MIVKRSDFGRVLAEFWADGLDSETPLDTGTRSRITWPTIPRSSVVSLVQESPCHHWRGMCTCISRSTVPFMTLPSRPGRTSASTASRPITLIRTLGARGQRSDPALPSYDPEGLPLSQASSRSSPRSTQPGERHAHLARYKGELAVWTWRGEPGDRDTRFGGHGWLRIKEWVSYQRRTFVSPAFPGYVSGHSCFSRAGAEVLTELSGSPYFPGGSSELLFESLATLCLRRGRVSL